MKCSECKLKNTSRTSPTTILSCKTEFLRCDKVWESMCSISQLFNVKNSISFGFCTLERDSKVCFETVEQNFSMQEETKWNWIDWAKRNFHQVRQQMIGIACANFLRVRVGVSVVCEFWKLDLFWSCHFACFSKFNFPMRQRHLLEWKIERKIEKSSCALKVFLCMLETLLKANFWWNQNLQLAFKMDQIQPFWKLFNLTNCFEQSKSCLKLVFGALLITKCWTKKESGFFAKKSFVFKMHTASRSASKSNFAWLDFVKLAGFCHSFFAKLCCSFCFQPISQLETLRLDFLSAQVQQTLQQTTFLGNISKFCCCFNFFAFHKQKSCVTDGNYSFWWKTARVPQKFSTLHSFELLLNFSQIKCSVAIEKSNHQKWANQSRAMAVLELLLLLHNEKVSEVEELFFNHCSWCSWKHNPIVCATPDLVSDIAKVILKTTAKFPAQAECQLHKQIDLFWQMHLLTFQPFVFQWGPTSDGVQWGHGFLGLSREANASQFCVKVGRIAWNVTEGTTTILLLCETRSWIGTDADRPTKNGKLGRARTQ